MDSQLGCLPWRTGGHVYLSMDNGAPVDCGAWSYTINDSGKGFAIGREGDRVANPWGGSIASVGLWKGRALSAGELTALYNNGNGLQYLDVPSGLLSDLISWWDLQEASGTRADSAGSNNLTENGTVGQASGIPGKYPSYTASYDVNGNQTVIVDASGNRTTNLWDSADRLSGRQMPGGNEIDLTYRFDDLLHRKSGPSGIDGLLRDDDGNILFQTQTQGGAMGPAPLINHSGDLTRAAGQADASTALDHQYLLDAQGSVQAVTDSTGATTASFSQDARGRTLSGSLANNPFDYAGNHGYWREPDTGLIYWESRWYDPASGQWLSVDPVEGEPRYAYCYNNPTANVDPSGLQGAPPPPYPGASLAGTAFRNVEGGRAD